jgi:hypothetical protein
MSNPQNLPDVRGDREHHGQSVKEPERAQERDHAECSRTSRVRGANAENGRDLRQHDLFQAAAERRVVMTKQVGSETSANHPAVSSRDSAEPFELPPPSEDAFLTIILITEHSGHVRWTSAFRKFFSRTDHTAPKAHI